MRPNQGGGLEAWEIGCKGWSMRNPVCKLDFD
jgi:hypothetical protein